MGCRLTMKIESVSMGNPRLYVKSNVWGKLMGLRTA